MGKDLTSRLSEIDRELDALGKTSDEWKAVLSRVGSTQATHVEDDLELAALSEAAADLAPRSEAPSSVGRALETSEAPVDARSSGDAPAPDSPVSAAPSPPRVSAPPSLPSRPPSLRPPSVRPSVSAPPVSAPPVSAPPVSAPPSLTSRPPSVRPPRRPTSSPPPLPSMPPPIPPVSSKAPPASRPALSAPLRTSRPQLQPLPSSAPPRSELRNDPTSESRPSIRAPHVRASMVPRSPLRSPLQPKRDAEASSEGPESAAGERDKAFSLSPSSTFSLAPTAPPPRKRNSTPPSTPQTENRPNTGSFRSLDVNRIRSARSGDSGPRQPSDPPTGARPSDAEVIFVPESSEAPLSADELFDQPAPSEELLALRDSTVVASGAPPADEDSLQPVFLTEHSVMADLADLLEQDVASELEASVDTNVSPNPLDQSDPGASSPLSDVYSGGEPNDDEESTSTTAEPRYGGFAAFDSAGASPSDVPRARVNPRRRASRSAKFSDPVSSEIELMIDEVLILEGDDDETDFPLDDATETGLAAFRDEASGREPTQVTESSPPDSTDVVPQSDWHSDAPPPSDDEPDSRGKKGFFQKIFKK